MTQREKVLKHIEQYGYIDSWTAINKYNITRLAAVVCEINKGDRPLKTVVNPFYRGFALYVPSVEGRVEKLKVQLGLLTKEKLPLDELSRRLIDLASKFIVCHQRKETLH